VRALCRLCVFGTSACPAAPQVRALEELHALRVLDEDARCGVRSYMAHAYAAVNSVNLNVRKGVR
jgi:hypothetical protein